MISQIFMSFFWKYDFKSVTSQTEKLPKMQDFVHLHVHTYYSILDGQSPINKIVDKAIANGMRGMAITDHGNSVLHKGCE